MRLTKIKLAGFKSFVDPTTLHLSGNLTGIVGPNGCGKSNVIDAVRWVMGESSARHLRGESMADVIFSGSSSRKPVGRAAIELVFDNSAGELGGPWVQYTEIAVKRQVERDGQSQYFLNGARCRRRDITDIFLGTGLGPRSYAIIEQGMISQVIEAKPEELRVFFEEAAGISKYKERRRETETRIRHTRENLERLEDLRQELGRQLEHLQRQAEKAEQYRRLKSEERQVRAELLALRWRDLDQEAARLEGLIRDRETAAEAVLAQQRRLEAELETGRERRAVLAEALEQAQAGAYEISAGIARLEQALGHRRELDRRRHEELERLETALARLDQEAAADRRQLAERETALAHAEPALEEARAVEAEVHEGLEDAEAAMGDWQSRWDDYSRRAAEPQRQAEVRRTGAEHLEQRLLRHARQVERLALERESLEEDGTRKEVAELERREQAQGEAVERDQQALAALEQAIAGLREEQSRLSAELDRTRSRLQSGRGRLASLETLQEAALGRHEDTVNAWLGEQGLGESPRLAEALNVETGWERAVETVLSGRLEAVCVAGWESKTLDGLERGSVTLLDTGMPPLESESLPNNTLGDKVRAPWPLDSLLAGVGLAEDLDSALARRHGLEGCRTLVTPDGVWLGRNWLRLERGDDAQAGVLARERDIQGLRADLEGDELAESRLSQALENLVQELADRERRRAEGQGEVNRGHREQAALQGELAARRGRLEQMTARRQAIDEELAELRRHAQEDEQALAETRRHLEAALEAMDRLTGEGEALAGEREDHKADLEEWRTRAGEARRQTQDRALAVESLRADLTATRQVLARLEAQQAEQRAGRERLQGEMPLGEHSQAMEQAQLEALLDSRLAAEQRLQEAREAVGVADQTLKDQEKARNAVAARVQEAGQAVQDQRLAWGEARVRRQTLAEQLQELGVAPSVALHELPAEADEAGWQERLGSLERRLQRLGAVNLAAIDECAQVAERKTYLDNQHQDLVQALETLEQAMARIDQETRARFRDTFEQVDGGFRALFPRLFGGGEAHLELTGEDLLETGVAIMARPPGKRVSNIHLLSGGEKALTAVALVFAIFQLNPAPFCLLDEVDAPLDEANVGRFGDLVREMSERVQFIFITHNKGTMEIARQLTGVTMHEPGVSRLVAVDVDEAVRLAAV